MSTQVPGSAFYVAAALAGLADGAAWTACPWLVARMFGTAHYGNVFGLACFGAAVAARARAENRPFRDVAAERRAPLFPVAADVAAGAPGPPVVDDARAEGRRNARAPRRCSRSPTACCPRASKQGPSRR